MSILSIYIYIYIYIILDSSRCVYTDVLLEGRRERRISLHVHLYVGYSRRAIIMMRYRERRCSDALMIAVARVTDIYAYGKFLKQKNMN